MEVKLELENGFSPFPDFLKIYNSQTVSQRVIIPKRYIKYYPKPLPQIAVLKKPEGNFWTVKWKASEDGTISFEDGWTKFVADNGIIERDFLLFTYDGSRSFWVRIHRNGLPLKPTAPVIIEEVSDETTGGNDAGAGNDDEDSNENMIVSLSFGSDDDDDGDETTGGNGDGDETTCNDDDSNENMIVSLSLGSDEDYEVDDDESYGDTMVRGATAAGSSKRDWSGRRNGACVSDPEAYLDDGNNAFFISTISTSVLTRGVLIIGQQAIRDHQLSFGGTIKLVDGFGQVTKNVGKWHDRVVVKKCEQIIKRNNAKLGDAVICEIFREGNRGIVHSIKAHFVKK